MQFILYAELNIVGLLLILLMLFNFGQKRSINTTYDSKLFNLLLVTTALVLLVDTIGWTFNNTLYSFSRAIIIVSDSIYYLLEPVLCLIWLLYCRFIVTFKRAENKFQYFLYFIPIIMCYIMLTVNLFMGNLFFIDSNNCYHRGSWYAVYSFVSLLYLIWSSLIVLIGTRNYKGADKRHFRKYLFFFPIPIVVGYIIQTLFYGIAIVWVCAVISLLIVYMNFQSILKSMDLLTGVNNRRKFDKYISYKTLNANIKNKFFLILLDVQEFKTINDIYGHAEGDRALISVAKVLKESVNKDDFVSRFANNEFTVCGERTSKEHVELLVDKIYQNLDKLNKSQEFKFVINIDYGISYYGENENKTPDEMIFSADCEMFLNKSKKTVSDSE